MYSLRMLSAYLRIHTRGHVAAHEGVFQLGIPIGQRQNLRHTQHFRTRFAGSCYVWDRIPTMSRTLLLQVDTAGLSLHAG